MTYRWEPGLRSGRVIDTPTNQIIEDSIPFVRARAQWPDIEDGRDLATILASLDHHRREYRQALHEGRMAKATVHNEALWEDEKSLFRALVPDPRPVADDYDTAAF